MQLIEPKRSYVGASQRPRNCVGRASPSLQAEQKFSQASETRLSRSTGDRRSSYSQLAHGRRTRRLVSRCHTVATDMWGVGGGGIAGLLSAILALTVKDKLLSPRENLLWRQTRRPFKICRRESLGSNCSTRLCVTLSATSDSSPRPSGSSSETLPARRRKQATQLLALHCLLLVLSLRAKLPGHQNGRSGEGASSL